MKTSDFLKFDGAIDRSYRFKLDARWPTMRVALNLLAQLPTHCIVETGTVRMNNDWGGGMSTLVFGDFVSMMGGRVMTIDNDATNLELCKVVTAQYADQIMYMHSDSVAALLDIAENPMLADYRRIDLLYLDSMDCPVVGDATLPQQHQLNELLAATPLLHRKSIVLLDDNGFENGGKCRLSNEWLIDNGWTCLMQHGQSLWIQGR